MLAPRSVTGLLALASACAVAAPLQPVPQPDPREAAAPASRDPSEGQQASVPAPARPAAGPARRDVEGAIGLLVQDAPDYLGSSTRSTSLRPVGYVRWGRFTLAGSGGMVTRRHDTLDGGFGAVLHFTDGLRVSASLRNDSGRRAGDSPALAGMGDIPRTFQGRLTVRWQGATGLQLRGAMTSDLSGRVGGSILDFSVAQAWPLGPGSDVTLSAGLGAATRSAMRTWHGVTPAQSLASGYPEYAPGAGLRDARVGLTWRGELSPRWGTFAGVTLSRVVGPAARSPLTSKEDGVTATSGVYWRF
jgi:outer membrane scaffolding protein for murein synthesis (MipA/OmpV family)